MRKNNLLKLTAALLLMAMLCACSIPLDTATGALSGMANYKVTVIGVDGKPASGVVVRFLIDGEQVAIQSPDMNGVAAKMLTRGNYTVELLFLDEEATFSYDLADLSLSTTKTELTIRLAFSIGGAKESILANGKHRDAYYVNTGSTLVGLDAQEITYFLYQPKEPGVYRFSTLEDTYFVGYYGFSDAVQNQDLSDKREDNAAILTVRPNMVGQQAPVLVLGVKNTREHRGQTMLQIQKIGEYINDQIPTEVYQTQAPLASWSLSDHPNSVVTRFDLTVSTDTYQFFKDDQTGFYHLGSKDGPLVVVCLGRNAQKHLPFSTTYDTILQESNVYRFFKDKDGQYVRQEEYTQCLTDYLGTLDTATAQRSGGCVDAASGLYPLTDDLMYIIQNHGEYAGWWDISQDDYLFLDDAGMPLYDINTELAWLFMCCYLTEN